MSVIRSLLPEQYAYKCALESILSAATWPGERVNSIYPFISPTCSRCNAATDSALHCFWQCPANANITDDAVLNTQSLVSEAVAKAGTMPCLWLRGVLPQSLTTISREYLPSNDIVIKYENDPDGQWRSGTYYGDASGGEFTSYPELRRCGCGVAAIHPDGTLHYGASFSLPGEIQTVPRGELYALLFLVDRLAPLTEVDFVTDNEGVFNIYNKGPKASNNSANCDLYSELFKQILYKAIRLTVRWMPSHLKPTDVRPPGVSPLDVQGNAHADDLAGKAAKAACVPLHVSTPYLANVWLTKKIQYRLATILVHLPNREKAHRNKSATALKPDIQSLRAATSHTLAEDGNRVRCSDCHSSFLQADPSFQHWLQSPCSGIGPSCDKPTPINFDGLHIGNSVTHHSHKLHKYRGLVYCKRCGCRAGLSLRKLSKPCRPPTTYGATAIAAISAGKLPPRLSQWPE